MGFMPSCIAGDTVVTQLTAGTIIFLFLNLPEHNKAKVINKFADEPELTKTEYLVPSHFEYSDPCLKNEGQIIPFK